MYSWIILNLKQADLVVQEMGHRFNIKRLILKDKSYPLWDYDYCVNCILYLWSVNLKVGNSSVFMNIYSSKQGNYCKIMFSGSLIILIMETY